MKSALLLETHPLVFSSKCFCSSTELDKLSVLLATRRQKEHCTIPNNSAETTEDLYDNTPGERGGRNCFLECKPTSLLLSYSRGLSLKHLTLCFCWCMKELGLYV